MLGAERAEAAGRARRRGDGRLRAGVVDRLRRAGDQVLADRLGVGLGEESLDLVVGRGGDPPEDRVGLVVAGLDALEVEDREPAEPGELAGDARRRRRRPSPTRGSGWRASMPANVCARSTSAGSMVSVPGASETSSKPYVGRIVSTFEWKTRRCAAPIRGVRRRRSVDHVALLCRLTVGCLWPRVYQRPTAVTGPRLPSGRQLEPGRALRVGEVVADALDRRPVAGPDDLAMGLVERQPAGAVVLVGQRGSASGATRTAKTAAVTTRVDRRLVELVHEVQVVERLDGVGIEAGLLAELAQRALGDALAGLERARRRTATGRQDAARRAAQQQDLAARRGASRKIQQSTRSGRNGLIRRARSRISCSCSRCIRSWTPAKSSHSPQRSRPTCGWTSGQGSASWPATVARRRSTSRWLFAIWRTRVARWRRPGPGCPGTTSGVRPASGPRRRATPPGQTDSRLAVVTDRTGRRSSPPRRRAARTPSSGSASTIAASASPVTASWRTIAAPCRGRRVDGPRDGPS